MLLVYISVLFLLSGGLNTVFLVEGLINSKRSPARIPDGSTIRYLLSLDEQTASPLSSRITSESDVSKTVWMKHGISAREANDDVAIPNHHQQAGSLAIYSIPQPPAVEKTKKVSKYWDSTIFYCTILIVSSTVVTICLVKNFLCPSLKDDCKNFCPCYDMC